MAGMEATPTSFSNILSTGGAVLPVPERKPAAPGQGSVEGGWSYEFAPTKGNGIGAGKIVAGGAARKPAAPALSESDQLNVAEAARLKRRGTGTIAAPAPLQIGERFA